MTEVTIQAETAPAEAPAENARPEHIPEKFWDAEKGEIRVEDMAKSYAELEKAKSTPQEGEGEGEGEGTTEEVDTAALAKEYGVPENVAQFAKTYADKGELTEADYTELEKLGYGKAVVDQFIAGAVAAANPTDPNAGFTEIAGDEAKMKEIADWAATNFSEEDIAAFNKASAEGDPKATEMFQTMADEFTKANGTPPARRVSGGQEPVQGDVFTSMAEFQREQNKPEYKSDPVFRQQVLDKFGRSRL